MDTFPKVVVLMKYEIQLQITEFSAIDNSVTGNNMTSQYIRLPIKAI